MLKNFFTKFLVPIFIFISFIPVSLQAAEVTQEQIKGLDEQVQDIKKRNSIIQLVYLASFFSFLKCIFKLKCMRIKMVYVVGCA